jgi:DNA-binding response OmpR family regulator
MREIQSDPSGARPLGRRTNFPVVPVTDIPAPGPSDTAAAIRPVVLVVDEESSIADALAEVLNRSGYTAIAAYDRVGALETALLVPPELAILGIGHPGAREIELAVALKSELEDCKILLLTEQSAKPTVLASEKKAGHKFDLLDRPVDPDELLKFVDETFKSRSPAAAGNGR